MHKNNSIHQNKSFQNFTPKPKSQKIYKLKFFRGILEDKTYA